MINTKLDLNTLNTKDNYINSLSKAWINTISDLLNHFPRAYDYRTKVLDNFSMINLKEKITILVKFISINSIRTRNNKILIKWVVEDKNWFLWEVVWFNRKFLITSLSSSIWKQVLLTWKIKYEYWKLEFVSPEINTDLTKLWWVIVPIYSDLNYISSKWISSKMELLRYYINDIKETLPKNILRKYSFISRKDAYEKIHFPRNNKDIEMAQSRLWYEELYNIHFSSLSRKYDNIKSTHLKSISINLNPELVKDIISNIEFILTDAQKISLFQILKDMGKEYSMSRLLEWDVGTGKTVVALISIIHSILETSKNSVRIQVAFMAPTEILAKQHFENVQELFFKYWISSHLLVWSMTAKQKEVIKKDIKSWNIDVIIWTHALIVNDVIFKILGLVIIDEQHRFWVMQRQILEKNISIDWVYPHVLNMTATPIPRTLALTLYWDQDLSVLDEYPKWRKEIFTKVIRNQNGRENIYKFIRNEIEKWRQIFWISPLVEKSEKIDLANAINTYENLKEVFKPFKIWLLHGRMKPKEKDEIIRSFADNKIQILSSTSVIEVGIDLPNSTVMCIEWAEKFWFSQLHQFRGRVGRGQYQSYCYLFPTSWLKTERLNAMEKTNNWFELSEIDLNLRWPWEVYWVRQSWIPDLKIADLKDLVLVSKIRDDIQDIFESK